MAKEGITTLNDPHSRRWDEAKIETWMRLHVKEYVDECNEVNCTAMTEAWDNACAAGEDTLDPNHIAWEIAVKIADLYEKGQL